jgi:hypothetical protein
MDAKWAAILINLTPSYNGRQMNIFEKKNKKNMSKLIYFKGICTLSIVWEAGPVVLSNCKNMLCINWNKMILIPPFEYAIRTFERQERHWDPFGIVIQYNRKDKTYAIDEDEIEDQSITRMIDAFRFITRCKKEINCHQVSFLKRENH